MLGKGGLYLEMQGMEAVVQAIEMQGLVFSEKPVLVGGRAMEYYGLRKSGEDVDLIVTDEDYQALAKLHPEKRKDIWGDLGVILWPLEIWRSIMYFDHAFYRQGAVDCGGIYVVSLEKLLLTRAYAMHTEKYKQDLGLILDRVLREKGNGEFLRFSHERASIYEKQAIIWGGNYDVEQ